VVLSGTVFFAALVLQANLMLPRKAMAGYYNYLGDFYKKSGDELLAEKFYSEANGYNFGNVKSIYSLAAIFQEKLYQQTEINTLKKGTEAYPSDKIFVRLANKYPDREALFDQLFLLQQGVKQFPRSGPLLNNLALLYGSTAMLDSANYYFDRAQQHIGQAEVINSNRLAFYILTGQGQPASEMARNLGDETYPPLQSNLLLWQSLNPDKQLRNPVELPAKPALTPAAFALVYQGGMLGQTLSDKATLKKIDQYLQVDTNEPYRFDLTLEKAFVQQRLGQALAARTTLENLAATEADYAGYLLDLIGLQLLQQKAYKAAAAHFDQARAKGWPDAAGHLLMALALQPDQRVEAMLGAEQLKAGAHAGHAALARQLAFLLRARPVQVITQASDSLKVQYLQINQHPDLLTDQEFLAITSTVNQPALKLLAEKELAAFYVSRESYPEASRVIQVMLPRLTEQNQTLSEVNLLQAEILLRTNNLAGLRQALDRMYLSATDKPKKLYYLAQLAERQQRPQDAQRYYDQALAAMPAHEPTVLAAAAFYNTRRRDGNKSYDLLLNSITYNPYNPAVYKAYILQSVAIGYGAFAESAMEELAKLLPPAQLAAFRQQYQQKKAEREAALLGNGQ
jgi:cellulose synthase operon protein C